MKSIYGRKVDAKKESNKARRRIDKKESVVPTD